MKYMIKKITAALLLTVLLCPICPATVFGASGASVSISGDRTVKEGEVLTITVTYQGSSLGYVNGHLTYDTNRLEYLSGGSSQGNAGLVQLKAYADDAGGKLSFPVKFRAVGSGSTALNLETLESQNLDGDQDMGTPSASRNVKVTKGAGTATTAPSEESPDKEETQESIQPEKASEADEDTADGESALETSEQKDSITVVPFVAGAVILVLAIAIIAVVLVRKKKRR